MNRDQVSLLPQAMPVEVQVASSWRCVDFISDLHLAADTPRTFDAWARYLQETPAEAVFILGDLFEVWVGDDCRFEGFEALCTDVLRKASQERTIGFMAGNRDFLLGSDMCAAAGIVSLSDPTVVDAMGQRILLTHGDALCIADTEYQAFRTLVRSASWQREFLARPLQERRDYAREVRNRSEMRKQAQPSSLDWVDIDIEMAINWLQQASAHVLIHGHTHRPATEAIGEQAVRHVLSDWDLDHEPRRAEVLRLTTAGLARMPVSTR